MKRMLAVILASFLSFAAYGETIKLDPKTTVRIRGVVKAEIVNKAEEMKKIAKTSNEVTLLINSPGGYVLPGLQFIDQMNALKERGITIRCVVPNLAASMAFQILAHCDSRYVMPSAILLFHPMKIGCFMCSLSADEMAWESARMFEMEIPLDKTLMEKMDVDEEFFKQHRIHETVWLGYVFEKSIPGFIKLIDNVEGIEDYTSMDEETQEFLLKLMAKSAKDF